MITFRRAPASGVDIAYETTKIMAPTVLLRMSAKASSIAVTRPGAVPSIPYRDEVVQALAEA